MLFTLLGERVEILFFPCPQYYTYVCPQKIVNGGDILNDTDKRLNVSNHSIPFRT